MLAKILTRAAARYGNKAALVTDTRTPTYTELDALSERERRLRCGIPAGGDQVSRRRRVAFRQIVLAFLQTREVEC